MVEQQREKEKDIYSISSKTRFILEGLQVVLEFMTKNNGMYRDDYKIALLKKRVQKRKTVQVCSVELNIYMFSTIYFITLQIIQFCI